jgi:DMSO/TMAO reductase YedYZ molybdopterin-dependent catalytic subunit
MSTTTSSGTRGSVSQPLLVGASVRAFLSGALAAAGALSLSELLAGILPGGSSLIAAVGQVVIDLQPPGAKDFMVELFGTNDKLAFELFIVVVALSIGGGLGLLARRRRELGVIGFAAFGAVGFFATLADPLASPTITVVAAAVSVSVGLWLLGWLQRPPNVLNRRSSARTAAIGASSATDSMPNWSRRSFLIRAGGVGVAATVAGIAGRSLLERQRVAPVGAGSAIPPASETVPALLPEADLSAQVAGITPIVVPNDRFYRIDTALLTPIVDTADWTLRVHGLVDRETTLTWDELIGLPMFEQYVTISCVSNQVGGNLVGNAKWTGVRLRDVLDMAGIQASATQLVGRSVDGWTAGMPTAWVMDPAREPMIAVKMNDDPLPPAHGYPARLIVPGLYGYVSATKWLKELELTTLESFDGYWVPLGWAKEAPILTQSRIDTPRGGVPGGTVPVAGIAWAPDRGVATVEVGVDGVWEEARLSRPISNATWVQWVYDWAATPGQHTVQVRATDGTGQTQPETRTPPAPDGARGWHTINVQVG